MYLRSLELQGFKSFADKTELRFDDDITAIVGPNGSGKSNISDAIRWVMGEQSTKALRGAKMEDVIFGGTQKRPQLGFAEASLALDNADRALPVDADEITVTRRYYRSGESEFYINKKSARLRDINELFMDTGLGKEGYANISQGRIDEILAVKSTDRRDVFEEAAGISKFRHRKEETERRLAATEDNLLRIGDKVSELELQVEPLREQAEKAKKYLALKEELKGVEIAVWLENLEKLSAAKKKAEEDYRSAAFILEQEHEALDALYQRAETLAGSLRDYDVQLEAQRGKISEKERELQRLSGEKDVLQAGIDNHTENLLRVRAELAEQEDRGTGMQAQIAQSESRAKEITEEMSAISVALETLDAQARKLSQESEGAAQTYLSLQNRLSDTRSQLAQIGAALESAKNSAQELQQRSSETAQELEAAEQKHAALSMQAEETAAALKTAREDVTAANNSLDGYRLRLQGREAHQAELQQTYNQLRVKADTLASRIHLLQEMEKDYEGYSRAVKVIMQEQQRGSLRNIHGPVSRLIHTEEEYAVAIETALGAAMQHIVVSAEADGKAAIQFLKRRDCGRATFLPVNVIRGRTLQESGLENAPGFIGIAAELVTYEKQYREIVENLLGRTVIAEDLDYAIPMARRYQNRFRIVTLDGQVINAGGSMTGGSVSRNAGILSRAGELANLKKQQEKLTERLKNGESMLREAAREVEAVRFEMEALSGRLREAEDRVLRLEGEKRHFSAMLDTVSDVIAADKRELAGIAERIRENERSGDAGQAQAALLEKQQLQLSQKLGSVELGRSEKSQQLTALMEQINAKKLERASLEAEREGARAAAAQLRQLYAKMEGDSQRSASLIASYEAEIATSQERLAELDAQSGSLSQETAAEQDALAALSRSRMTAEAEKTIAERNAQDKNKTILNMERESARLEQKKLSAELEEKQILDKLWENYELTRSTALPLRAEIESAAQGQRRCGELKRKIHALGTPNLGAIEEYARVSERYEYLCTQRDDVLAAKRDLLQIIGSLTTEMTEIFTTEFAKINEYFGKTFTEMFGGGRASLELEDPELPLECGIEIRVQPPGKQVKTITLLSGGEKAFVAIALYFAILKVRPTPFCMLDEIDAALDDRNVERFASYLRNLSKGTQFIVVTHRRGTMEEADMLYGVTMQEQGVSKMIHLDMNQMTEQLGITE